jgi:hypothetical protein
VSVASVAVIHIPILVIIVLLARLMVLELVPRFPCVRGKINSGSSVPFRQAGVRTYDPVGDVAVGLMDGLDLNFHYRGTPPNDTSYLKRGSMNMSPPRSY